jgi:hypothetical protein
LKKWSCVWKAMFTVKGSIYLLQNHVISVFSEECFHLGKYCNVHLVTAPLGSAEKRRLSAGVFCTSLCLNFKYLCSK